MGEAGSGSNGPVVVGVIPGAPARVLTEAARYARVFETDLIVAFVDVTRFVTYDDSDGAMHSAPIDLSVTGGARDLERVRAEADAVLAQAGVPYAVHSLVGDPAMAMKQLADEVDATVIVVGTRRRGFGESVREFFTGSVAARLAHRQHRPVLVVPLGEPAAADEDLWVE